MFIGCSEFGLGPINNNCAVKCEAFFNHTPRLLCCSLRRQREADEAEQRRLERHPEFGHAGAVLAGARLASDGEHLPNGLPVASAWPAGERVAIYVKYKAVRVFIKTKTHQRHSMATLATWPSFGVGTSRIANYDIRNT